MTYKRVFLRVEIVFESGMHIGTGFGVAKLLDERTMQGPNKHTGVRVPIPYIPGSSIKGRLRAKAEELSHALFSSDDRQAYLVDLFGTNLFERGCQPGRLMFADAQLNQADATTLPYLALERRPHVALSRKRRCAKENMLMTIEVASPGLFMETTIEGWLPYEYAEREVALLVLAIRATTHIGGHKGRGLGAVQMTPTEICVDGKDVALEALEKALGETDKPQEGI